MRQHEGMTFAVDQQEMYECFCFMIDRNEGSLLFLDALGGTGKTFYNIDYFSKASIRR